MKPALEKMLRPQAGSGWLKLSEALETEIREAAAVAVPGDVFSSEGAGWMQEAFRMDLVGALAGRAATADEDEVMAQDAGRLAAPLRPYFAMDDDLTEQQRVAAAAQRPTARDLRRWLTSKGIAVRHKAVARHP